MTQIRLAYDEECICAGTRIKLHQELDNVLDAQLRGRTMRRSYHWPPAMVPTHKHITKLSVVRVEFEDQYAKEAFYRALDAYWHMTRMRPSWITFSPRSYTYLLKQEWYQEAIFMEELAVMEHRRHDIQIRRTHGLLGLNIRISSELPDSILYELE